MGIEDKLDAAKDKGADTKAHLKEDAAEVHVDATECGQRNN